MINAVLPDWQTPSFITFKLDMAQKKFRAYATCSLLLNFERLNCLNFSMLFKAEAISSSLCYKNTNNHQGHSTIIFGGTCSRESNCCKTVFRCQTAISIFTKTSPKRFATREMYSFTFSKGIFLQFLAFKKVTQQIVRGKSLESAQNGQVL